MCGYHGHPAVCEREREKKGVREGGRSKEWRVRGEEERGRERQRETESRNCCIPARQPVSVFPGPSRQHHSSE